MEVRQMPSTVLTLVFIGLLLGVGMYILQEFRNVDQLTTTNTVGNTTQYSSVTTSAKDLGYDNIINDTFKAYNHTGTYTLQPGVDYSLDPPTGYITLTSAGSGKIEGGLLNVSFSNSVRTDSYTGVNQTLNAINEFPTWLTIIVVVIAASIIIGLVLKGFGGAGGVV